MENRPPSESGAPKGKTRFYKKSTFVTHLPVTYLYTPSHYWLHEVSSGLWQVGMTRFSTRMLGNLVDFGFEAARDSAVSVGRIIGWIEGFKAITDVYCVGDGTFVRTNPLMDNDMEAGWKDNYRSGWFYEFHGTPDPRAMDVETYAGILDTTIDKILEQQKNEENTGT